MQEDAQKSQKQLYLVSLRVQTGAAILVASIADMIGNKLPLVL